MPQGVLTQSLIDLEALELDLERLCRREGVAAFLIDPSGRPLTKVICPQLSADDCAHLTAWFVPCTELRFLSAQDRDVLFTHYGHGQVVRMLCPLYHGADRLGFLGLIRLTGKESENLIHSWAKQNEDPCLPSEENLRRVDEFPFEPDEGCFDLLKRFSAELLPLLVPDNKKPASDRLTDEASKSRSEDAADLIERQQVSAEEEPSALPLLQTDWLEALALPMVVLDKKDRILFWSGEAANVLKISPQAVLLTDFDALILAPKKTIWKSWLQSFRSDPGKNKFFPDDTLPVLDNDGDMVRIKCQLSRDSRLPADAILVAFVQWERESDFSRQAELILLMRDSMARRPLNLVTDFRGDLLPDLNPKWSKAFAARNLKRLAIVELLDSPPRGQIAKHLQQLKTMPDQTLTFTGSMVGESCSISLQLDQQTERIQWILSRPQQNQKTVPQDDSPANWQLEPVFVLLNRLGEKFDSLLQELIAHVESAFPSSAQLPEAITKTLQKASNLSRQLSDLNAERSADDQIIWLKTILYQAIAIQQQLFPVTVGFHLDLDRRPCVVRGDAGQLYRAFSRLFDFLRRSLPDGGQIAVRMRRQTEHPVERIDLEISGAGQKYVKGGLRGLLDRLQKDGDLHSGLLDLASAYSIFKKHGGELQMVAQADDQSVFLLALPAIEVAEQAAAPQDESSHQTVLLIDDDAEIIEINTLMLVKNGFRVCAACSAQEGIDFLRDHPNEVDLVMVDVMLPDWDGVKLAETLVAQQPNLPIILSSGVTPISSHWRFLNEHRSAWLQKPFTCQSLVHTISSLLQPPSTG